jgi:N-acetylmuramoyl-L-alanine amidase
MISESGGDAPGGRGDGSKIFPLAAAATAALAVALLVPAAGPKEAGPKSIDFDFPPHGFIRWQRGGQPALVVVPLRGDGWISIARRYGGSASVARSLREANPDLRSPMRDRRLRVPLVILYDDLRLLAVQRLFPVDKRVVGGWQHWVLEPFDDGEESWRWLGLLFAGDEGAASAIAEANRLPANSKLDRGRAVLIPEEHLLPVFRSLPPVATPTPAADPVQARPRPLPNLEYGRDDRGEYALYRLRQGEALYSAVVVRFTGQLIAEQVNETALEIAERSGIEDVTEIPIGYPVKIPFELLLPEFLPADHPQRLAWVAEQRELGRFFDRVRAADLSGVQIVLDAGHGGRDSGATFNGIWEATYAYDIMCRIKANLERHTKARVWTTIEYPDVGFSPRANDRLPQTRNARLLTRPKYDLNNNSVLGVHLRWYLTNDIILNRLGPSFPREKTVFLSVHADSLHPSVRGAMIYVPSRYLRPEEPYTVKRKDIKQYSEYRNHPTVRLGADFKARVEASSRYLASNIVSSLENNGIEVHPYEPVRDRVLRGRSAWVPAVLRYTAAQNAVLVEVCNMANAGDRAQLLQASWREQFAKAVVEGVAEAFAN